MKAKIYRSIPGGDVIKRVAPPMKRQVALRQFGKAQHTFTLAVFPSQRGDVVLSGAVKHVLADIPQSEHLVAVAGCFTLEALNLLQARKAEIFMQSEESWSDASWQNMRVVIGSPVKAP
jgi:hypothetical protein